MKWNFLLLLVVLVLSNCAEPAATPTPEPTDHIEVMLPQVRLKGDASLEETLLCRRSIREYADEALMLEQVSQLLWAAQGITAEWGGAHCAIGGRTLSA